MKKYDIAAYVWPAYTGDEPRTTIFWPEGMGEWETIKHFKPLYEGHQWPRKPLWGYVNEANPAVMEMEIEEAVSHGVNVFIYDWYWFDNRPFLEQCLDNGFLKAKNRDKAKFYIMWANHNVTYGWDRRIASQDESTFIWEGVVTRSQFEEISHRLIDNYFKLDCYYKIDGKPVFSIYDLNNLIKGLGGIEETKDAMDWLDNECKKAGLKGIHYQLVKYGIIRTNYTGFDSEKDIISPAEVCKILPFSSLTHYQFIHFAHTGKDYLKLLEEVVKEWESIEKEFKIPYYPHISISWDNTPRYGTSKLQYVSKNSTPENFKKALLMAKEYADKHNVNLITINSWNEWTEGSYLEPDDLNGYGYLDAVREVFGK